MFNHVDVELPRLDRETIDGVRYYKVPDEEELLRLVSITSVTSHFNKEIFVKWRKKVGDEEADRITKRATSRGTDMHTLVEHHLKNEDLPKVRPISDFLFKISKEKLNLINDQVFVESKIQSLQYQAKSQNYIKQYLVKKGINKHLIEEQISLFYENNNKNIEKENALKFAKKRNLLDNEQDYQKKLSKMARAGFGYDVAKEILK